jgi:hypothetical protein
MSNEQIYFDALKTISRDYMSSDELRRKSEREYGLPFEEAMEMAYDNIQTLANAAIKGKRRPK